eukprot:1978914-Alexandrium_andersonii.AAC.1
MCPRHRSAPRTTCHVQCPMLSSVLLAAALSQAVEAPSTVQTECAEVKCHVWVGGRVEEGRCGGAEVR